MAFYDVRLSECVEQGFQGGPQFNTAIVPNDAGYDARIATWAQAPAKYQASYNQFEPADGDEIYSAFMAMYGQVHSFRFKDWRDFVLDGESLGVGNGTSTPRQIIKEYAFGTAAFQRIIRLPVAGYIVRANGTPITTTVDDEGLLTPAAPWPSGQILTIEGEFDVRVRFASDYYPWTMPENNLSRVAIDLVEALIP